MMIMDTNGRAWQRLENLDGNEIQIEASQLNPGIYYYLVQEEGQTLSHGQLAVMK